MCKIPKLALAAMLNGTVLGNVELFLANPEAIRQTLLATARDYFALDPESQQFDEAELTRYLSETSLARLVATLDEMGRNPFSSNPSPMVCTEDGVVTLWDHFVETESAKASAGE
jgi:hypothetical protein